VRTAGRGERDTVISGPSFAFVGFGVVIAALAVAVRSRAWRQAVLLLASLYFLSTFSRDPSAFLPLVGFVLAGFVALRAVTRWPERTAAIAVALVLVLFVWIKKYAFVPSGLWMGFPYVTVGISYMLFRLLHLILEVRADPEFAGIPFRTYLQYMIGFNTLIAGPIQGFVDFREQELAAPESPRPSLLDVGAAAERIVVGLFKTNVLAALLANLRDTSLAALHAAPGAADGSRLLGGAATFVLYPLFLYCNFSGYIDIVIGLSRLFLQRLPENFDRPFSATSFIDFWNRWHITLSRWLRTYVYNPLLLAAMRRYPSRRAEAAWAVLAFFVTFFLIGVWHGQTTAFLFFGFLQGLGVSVNKLYQIAMTKRLGRKPFDRLSSSPLYELVARGLTFTWFTFTLTWFWASWSDAARVWSALDVGAWTVVWIGIWAVSALVLGAWEVVRARALAAGWAPAPTVASRRVRTVWYTVLLVIVAVVALLAQQSAPEIVYKNF
jgi:alginate O-acetyltransferase complex protein AlgI